MKALVKYFGVARLINLPTRQDRLVIAKEELAGAGTTLGPGGVQPYSAKLFTDRGKFPWNPNVRGCFHSHTQCIRDAKRKKKKSVLILEDDIALSNAIGAFAPSIVAQLEAVPWDMVYFSYRVAGKNKFLTPRTQRITLSETSAPITTSSFYAVNSRIFDRLLNHLDHVEAGVEGDQEFGPMPIDGAFNVFRRLNPDVRVFLAEPQIGWQRSSRSDISPSLIDRFESLRPAVDSLRNLRRYFAQIFRI